MRKSTLTAFGLGAILLVAAASLAWGGGMYDGNGYWGGGHMMNPGYHRERMHDEGYPAQDNGWGWACWRRGEYGYGHGWENGNSQAPVRPEAYGDETDLDASPESR